MTWQCVMLPLHASGHHIRCTELHICVDSGGLPEKQCPAWQIGSLVLHFKALSHHMKCIEPAGYMHSAMRHALLGCRILPYIRAVFDPPAHMRHKPAVQAGCSHLEAMQQDGDAMRCPSLQLHGAFLPSAVQTVDASQVSAPPEAPVLGPADKETPRACLAVSTWLVPNPSSAHRTPPSPHQIHLPGQSAPVHVCTRTPFNFLCQCMPPSATYHKRPAMLTLAVSACAEARTPSSCARVCACASSSALSSC